MMYLINSLERKTFFKIFVVAGLGKCPSIMKNKLQSVCFVLLISILQLQYATNFNNLQNRKKIGTEQNG